MQLLSSIADLKDIVNKEYIDSILADYVLKANLGALATKDSLAFSDLTSRPSKLSDFTDDVVAGKYLPLTGGTISGTSVAPLIINTSSSESSVVFRINSDSKTQIGYNPYLGSFIYNYSSSKSIGIKDDGTPHYNGNTIYHAGNFNPADYLPLSGGTITGQLILQSGRDVKLILDNTDSEQYNQISIRENGVEYAAMYWTREGTHLNGIGNFYYNSNTLIHSGNYADYALPLSGGILRDSWSGGTEIRRSDSNNGYASLIFSQSDGTILGRFGFGGVDNPLFITQSGAYNILIHSGNIGSQIVEGITTHTGDATNANGDIAKLNSYYSSKGFRISRFNGLNGLGIANSDGLIVNWPLDHSYGQQWYMDDESHTIQVRYVANAVWSDWKTIAFTDSNVASATKLATARTIWGQSFDGTGNITGNLTLGNRVSLCVTDNSGTAIDAMYITAANHLVFGTGAHSIGGYTFIGGDNLFLRYGSPSPTIGVVLNQHGNVTIGGSDLAGTTYKMSVDGKVHIRSTAGAGMTEGAGSLIVGKGTVLMIDANDIQAKTNGTTAGPLYINDWGGNVILCGQNNGNVGIGTTSPQYKLDVAGSIRTTSSLTIGTIVLTDENGTLKIAGNAYTTGQLGAGEAGQPTSGGGSVQYWSNEYDMDIGTDVLVSSKEYIGTNTIVGWDLAGSCLNDLYIGYDGYTIWMQGSVDEASDMRLKTVIDAVNLDIRDIAFAPIFNYVFKSRPQGRQMLGSSAQYWQTIAPSAVSENDKGNLAMNYGAIALASVVAVAKKTLTHEEEIANLKLKVQSLETRLAKYELN